MHSAEYLGCTVIWGEDAYQFCTDTRVEKWNNMPKGFIKKPVGFVVSIWSMCSDETQDFGVSEYPEHVPCANTADSDGPYVAKTRGIQAVPLLPQRRLHRDKS